MSQIWDYDQNMYQILSIFSHFSLHIKRFLIIVGFKNEDQVLRNMQAFQILPYEEAMELLIVMDTPQMIP